MQKQEKLLRWHGSKRALAPTILKLFPEGFERMTYVEPFMGSAAVFFVKPPSRNEVLSDLDEELVNFLITVKLHSRELARTLALVPNSRRLFARFMDTDFSFSTIFRAARFFYLNHTSFGGKREHWAIQGVGGGHRNFAALRTRIFRAARRLQDAVIEHLSWEETLEKYDSPTTLFYIDPPYLGLAPYRHPFGLEDWKKIRARLETLKGKFILSAEGTSTMKLLFRGFRKRLLKIHSSLGPNDRTQPELLAWNYR